MAVPIIVLPADLAVKIGVHLQQRLLINIHDGFGDHRRRIAPPPPPPAPLISAHICATYPQGSPNAQALETPTAIGLAQGNCAWHVAVGISISPIGQTREWGNCRPPLAKPAIHEDKRAQNYAPIMRSVAM